MVNGHCQVHNYGSYPYFHIRRDRTKMDYLCRRYRFNIINTRNRALARSGQRRERKLNMGALIMFGFVSLIAIIGGIYFYLEEKKEIHTR